MRAKIDVMWQCCKAEVERVLWLRKEAALAAGSADRTGLMPTFEHCDAELAGHMFVEGGSLVNVVKADVTPSKGSWGIEFINGDLFTVCGDHVLMFAELLELEADRLKSKPKAILHHSGPWNPETGQVCTRCGKVIAAGLENAAWEEGTDPPSGWKEDTEILMAGTNPTFMAVWDEENEERWERLGQSYDAKPCVDPEAH